MAQSKILSPHSHQRCQPGHHPLKTLTHKPFHTLHPRWQTLLACPGAKHFSAGTSQNRPGLGRATQNRRGKAAPNRREKAFQPQNKPLASGSQGQDRPQRSRSLPADQGHFSAGKRRGLGLARPRQAAGKSFASGGSGAFQPQAKLRAYGGQGQIRGANGARARKLRQPRYASHTFGKLLAQHLPSPRATLTSTHQPNFKPPAPLPMA